VNNSCSIAINTIAIEAFETLANRFPVCTASDEFHYFPQVRSAAHQWAVWDDFSRESVQDMAEKLVNWDHQLEKIDTESLLFDERVDIRMMRRVLRTLKEQLLDAAVHRSQPTFHLTIMGIGLAEAIEAGAEALESRLENLPDFLDRAGRTLHYVPEIFRDQGCDMLCRLKQWLPSLPLKNIDVSPVMAAMERLLASLENMIITPDFTVSPDFYQRIAGYHMGCGMSVDEITAVLDEEIRETRSVLEETAGRVNPGLSWQKALEAIPPPPVPGNSLSRLYQSIISDLGDHCRTLGLISEEQLLSAPVTVEPIPEYMRPVRSNAAYSMPPGHPPTGGTFYLMETANEKTAPRDYRLLTAHETFPGHHLLDTRRWGQERIARRHIEFPLFYEGWASFSEELMFDTGFFESPADRMLLAKRRYWRAMRGRVDLDIQYHRKTLDEAALFLSAHGLPQNKAVEMVQRYILKPGYQLVYTIGRCIFSDLYQAMSLKGNRTVEFARQVLDQGEIGFDDLEQIIK